MAQFHVYASVIKKTNGQGRSRDFAAYLERQDMENATQTLRYLARDGRERNDLVESGSAHLPPWAMDAQNFWSNADRYERGGDIRPGLLARHFQFTLPRELSPQGRLDLATDIRTVFFREYPHTWAIHCPPANEGPGDNPHLHVMFSTRRDDTGRICEPAAWFSKARPDETGGIRKDRSWDNKERLQGIRYETMLLANAALEREDYAVAVTHDRLRGLGLDRAGVHYGQHAPKDAHEEIEAIKAQQAVLREDWHPWEQDTILRAWQTTKAREQLTDLSREAMVDHCRDRFWLHDRSPLREAEREASVERTLARGFHHAGLDRVAVQEARQVRAQEGRERSEMAQRPRHHGEEAPIDLDKVWSKPLIGNNASKIYHEPGQKNYGDVAAAQQAWFFTAREAQEAGYRRAANDHYGHGSEEAREPESGAGGHGKSGDKTTTVQTGRRTTLRALLTDEDAIARHWNSLAISLRIEDEGRGR